MKKFLKKTHFEKYNTMLEDIIGFDFYKAVDNIPQVKKTRFVGDNLLLEAFKKLVPNCADDSMMRSVLSSTFHFYRTKNIYSFEETLTNLLWKTSIKKIDTDFLRSPHDNIYISIPKIDDFVIPNTETGMHRVEAIYLTVIRVEEVDDFKILDYDSNTDAKLVIRYLLVGENKSDSPLGENDDALFYNTLVLGDGDAFEQMKLDLGSKKSRIKDEMDLQLMEKYHSFIVNILLYISSAQARIELFNTQQLEYSGQKKKKLKRIEKENSKLSKIPNFFKVGCKTLSVNNCGNSFHEGQKITTQFKVSPHWHLYWTGKDRKTKKLNWIFEYTKGKDFAESIDKVTKVTKVK